MASKKVALYKYIRLPLVGWKYCKAVFHDNNRIKAHAVMVGDVEQTIKDGYYVLSYQRRWEPVGNDPQEAQRLLLLRRAELAAVAHGGKVVSSAPTAEGRVQGTVKDAFDAWLQDHTDGGADVDTIRLKSGVAREFQESCREKMLSGVTRQHCLRYCNEFLKKKGNGDRTRFNKFLHLKQMLEFHKLDLITSADRPRYEEPEPLALEDEELEIFWQHCPAHKRLLYTVLLCTGLRKSEIKTLRWVDLISGNEPHIRIQSRPEWDFHPKKFHQRNVDVANNQELWAQLMRRKMMMLSKSPASPLVFPTRSGKPNTHLWDDTQALFKKAGLPKEKAHPHCWRATYCTTLMRQKVDYNDIMKLMGHADISSTMRYLAVLNREKRHIVLSGVQFKIA